MAGGFDTNNVITTSIQRDFKNLAITHPLKTDKVESARRHRGIRYNQCETLNALVHHPNIIRPKYTKFRGRKKITLDRHLMN